MDGRIEGSEMYEFVIIGLKFITKNFFMMETITTIDEDYIIINYLF